jgi:hypothetical protein
MRTLRCTIEDLESWYPGLFLEPHSVSCVAVMSRYSTSPAKLDVACEGIGSRWLGAESALRLEDLDLPGIGHEPQLFHDPDVSNGSSKRDMDTSFRVWVK